MVRLTQDGSHTLFNQQYHQTFHSDKGAVTESKHVFLQASRIADLLQQGQNVNVLEVGFGTGLNFFLTADLALQTNANLVYTALEKTLLPSSIMQALNFQPHLQTTEILNAFYEFRNALGDNPVGQYSFEYHQILLTLRLGEATAQDLEPSYFNAIYQDAFSPDSNPELWAETFFTKLYNTLKIDGHLTTYSVKGEVRRALHAVGFKVEKHPGPPGGKREMLIAVKSGK
jgi:tRNA U34 5-methylaminomethyl-2-thiouridine-forming methyltransferase MnmC